MVGFEATGEITEDDFKNVVMPRVQEAIDRNYVLNYMLVLDTSIKNFTVGSWLSDALMGFKHLFRWNRAAIITDVEAIITFTDGFSKIMPGEFRGYPHKDMQKAIDWVAGVVNQPA